MVGVSVCICVGEGVRQIEGGCVDACVCVEGDGVYGSGCGFEGEDESSDNCTFAY